MVWPYGVCYQASLCCIQILNVYIFPATLICMCPRGLCLLCLSASPLCHFHLAFSPRYWTNSRSLPAACGLCSSTFCPLYSALPFLIHCRLNLNSFPCFFRKVILLLRWASRHWTPPLGIQDSDQKGGRKKNCELALSHCVLLGCWAPGAQSCGQLRYRHLSALNINTLNCCSLFFYLQANWCFPPKVSLCDRQLLDILG